jgi:hypothetical protein
VERLDVKEEKGE